MRKSLALFVGFLAAGIGSPMPQQVLELLGVAGLCVAGDTLFGLWLAYVQGKMRVRYAARMAVSKLVQYAALLLAFTAAALLADSWFWINAGLMGVISIEVLSLLTTATHLQAHGVNLGPIQPLLQRLQKYLLHNMEDLEQHGTTKNRDREREPPCEDTQEKDPKTVADEKAGGGEY